VSFDIEEGEPSLAVAHSQIKASARRKFFNRELLE
jgi:hypothetical protein